VTGFIAAFQIRLRADAELIRFGGQVDKKCKLVVFSSLFLFLSLLFNKQFVYNCTVIESFANTETERLFATGKSRRLPPDMLRRAVMRWTQLDAATVVEDMRQPPSNRLEVLSGNRAGQWSIRINDQWRVCFRFERGNAFEVEIVDDH
jgi:proteic killer suppression protein